MVPVVTVLASALDTGSAEYAARRAEMLAKLGELDAEHAKALAGGGQKYVKRHRDRGKLTVRERVELLIDPDSPFLELSALAGHGTGFPVGGSGVRGTRAFSGTAAMIRASAPSARGGSPKPWHLVSVLPGNCQDALPTGRSWVARLNWHRPGGGPALVPAEPAHDPDELLGIVPLDLKIPFDPREVIARIVDGSEFDEFKPLYGTSLVTGWAAVHGYPIGILANARGILFSAESQKAAQFIQLANQIGVPLLFLQNTTGYMVGASYEQAGIIKHGAMMINAGANNPVPHLTVVMGASSGAGNYGMCGRAYDPRFLFSWPSANSAVMGPSQLGGVLSIVVRQGSAAS